MSAEASNMHRVHGTQTPPAYSTEPTNKLYNNAKWVAAVAIPIISFLVFHPVTATVISVVTVFTAYHTTEEKDRPDLNFVNNWLELGINILRFVNQYNLLQLFASTKFGSGGGGRLYSDVASAGGLSSSASRRTPLTGFSGSGVRHSAY